MMKPIPQSKSELIPQIRCTKAQKDRITWLAKQYADGNVSAWMLHCALNLRPRAYIGRDPNAKKKPADR